MKLLDVAPEFVKESSNVMFWAIVAVIFVLAVCLFFVWRYWRKHSYRRFE